MRVRCESSGAMVPKDKAIKRFIVRNIVDASALRDMQEACVVDSESAELCRGWKTHLLCFFLLCVTHKHI